MSEKKLTDPLLIIRGISQKVVRFLGDSLKRAEAVRIRVSPYRPLFSAALILHAVLAQKGYVVETYPTFTHANSSPMGKEEVIVELTVSNRGGQKTCNLSLRANSQSEKQSFPYNPASQLLFLMTAEELTVLSDAIKALGEATVLQHELVPQSVELIDILKGLGVQSLSSRFISFAYSKNFNIVDSLVSSLKPFLPDISLEDPARISNELSMRGIDPRFSLNDMDEQKIRQTLDYVAEKTSQLTKVAAQYQRLFPGIYASEGVGRREYDLRLLAGIMDVMVEVNPTSIVMAAMKGDLRILEASFNVYSSKLKALFKSVAHARLILFSGTRILVMEETELPAPLSYLRDNLVVYGMLGADDTIIVRKDSAKASNCFLLAQPLKFQLRPVQARAEWCTYNVDSEELQKAL